MIVGSSTPWACSTVAATIVKLWPAYQSGSTCRWALRKAAVSCEKVAILEWALCRTSNCYIILCRYCFHWTEIHAHSSQVYCHSLSKSVLKFPDLRYMQQKYSSWEEVETRLCCHCCLLWPLRPPQQAKEAEMVGRYSQNLWTKRFLQSPCNACVKNHHEKPNLGIHFNYCFFYTKKYQISTFVLPSPLPCYLLIWYSHFAPMKSCRFTMNLFVLMSKS